LVFSAQFSYFFGATRTENGILQFAERGKRKEEQRREKGKREQHSGETDWTSTLLIAQSIDVALGLSVQALRSTQQEQHTLQLKLQHQRNNSNGPLC
jgi:hypothetical protein